MKRITAALALAAFFVNALSNGFAESLTMTTWYPAPVGVYQSLVTTGGSPSSPVNTILSRDAGRVGIGTSNPQRLFHVNGDMAIGGAAGGGHIVSTNYNGALVFDAGADDGSGNAGMFFRSNTGQELMRVNANGGNVGIGTSNPAAPISLGAAYPANKLFLWDGGVGYSYGFGIRSHLLQMFTDSNVSDIAFGHGGGTDSFVSNVTFKGSGNVGIGTNGPSYKLDVNGSIRGYGITDASDLRLKKDVEPLSNSLDKILALRGVRYEWKDAAVDQSPQIGLIGQEVEKVYPELVKTDDQGRKSLNYSHLVAPLIEAVKAQQEEISTLRKQNEFQQKQIENQQTMLESFKKDLAGMRPK